MTSDEQSELLAKIPEAMRRDLQDQIDVGNTDFAEKMAVDYLAMDPVAQEEVAAFHEQDGVRRMREIKLRHHEGIPTSSDLELMVNGEPTE